LKLGILYEAPLPLLTYPQKLLLLTKKKKQKEIFNNNNKLLLLLLSEIKGILYGESKKQEARSKKQEARSKKMKAGISLVLIIG